MKTSLIAGKPKSFKGYGDQQPRLLYNWVKGEIDMEYQRVPLVYPNVREGYYEIDTDGNIYVTSTGEIRRLKIHDGYVYCACVGITRKYTHVSVHRALGYAFLGLTPELEINHINGDGTDNRLENLEVVTHQENINHSIETGLAPKGEIHKNSTHKDEYVHQMCKYFEDGYNNVQIFELLNGVEYDNSNLKHKRELNSISRIRRGERWQHISPQYNFQSKVYGTNLKRNK